MKKKKEGSQMKKEDSQMKKLVRKGNYEGGCSLKKEVEAGCSCCEEGCS